MLVKRQQSVREGARFDWLDVGGADGGGKVPPPPLPLNPSTPPSGKRAGVFSRASASVATRFSRCLEPHKRSHNHQSHTCEN